MSAPRRTEAARASRATRLARLKPLACPLPPLHARRSALLFSPFYHHSPSCIRSFLHPSHLLPLSFSAHPHLKLGKIPSSALDRISSLSNHLATANMSEQAVADIGLIGLAVMGQNLILNMNDKGYTVVAYNRTTSKVDDFLNNEAKGTKVVGAHSIEEFVAKLKRPRKMIILVKAGAAVDAFIDQLVPHLEKGDIIIDGGNSHYPDSIRRTQELEAKGLLFVGSGVSGGEEGARHGPSIMPGGSEAAWPHIKEIFQKTAAQSDGEPCCDWVGGTGSGHYVKMVHNGIEYGDMQLICEAYDILKLGLGLKEAEIGDIFTEWNKGVLDSFLIEITRDILKYNDEDGEPVVTKILDSAGQKGTGKWTAINALDLGQPVTLIGEAVFARCLSSLKGERTRASKILNGPQIKPFEGDKKQFIADLEQALYASKIVSYAQGFMLMREAAKEYGWKLNNPSIALMWRGGCIIRSVFLKDITAAFRKNPELENLLFDDFFNQAIHNAQEGWRRVVAQAILWGIPTPAFSTALAFFDGYRRETLPANLLQAQRDYFGAHTFRVLPEKANARFPEGQDNHVNWTGRGGNVSASTYQA
ncbi:phosphogluconate dehydrogenase (decarboxylating) gnd1 [Thecaphora frezii]